MKRFTILFLLGAALPVFASPAPQGDGTSPAFDRCMDGGDAAQGISFAIQQCINDEIVLQERKLDEALAAKLNRLDRHSRRRLTQSQRAWAARRHRKCFRESGNMEGSQGRNDYRSCTLDEIMKRTAWLRGKRD